MREIQLLNTLTGKKEKLETLEPDHVRMYACGVTVYDNCHIGHAMQAIYFDVIRSYLEYSGYRVTYVRNYTDVDDKIINRARERGITPKALVDAVIKSSEDDMHSIGVRSANHEPRVSESIPQIISMIQSLVTKGYAYANADGDVYYRVLKKQDYGKLSNRKVDELRVGTRDLATTDKEDDLDFALWKHDETPGASWESPWGQGRPGWHIECSAMAKMFLGATFDIHGGGRDLVFPHHENEIAQSEAANGCQYARYWMHSGLLTINKQKMSKSLGNQILIKDFVARFPGEVLRLAYLNFSYTSNVDFSEQTFRQAARRLLYFYESLQELDKLAAQAPAYEKLAAGFDPESIKDAFHHEMSNDFGTVGAMRELLFGFRKANELRLGKATPSKNFTARAYTLVLRELFGVLGLLKMDPQTFITQLKTQILKEMNLAESEIDRLILERNTARQNKDWPKADSVRQELLQLNIEVMDSPEGTRWTIIWKEDEA